MGVESRGGLWFNSSIFAIMVMEMESTVNIRPATSTLFLSLGVTSYEVIKHKIIAGPLLAVCCRPELEQVIRIQLKQELPKE